MRKAIGLLLLVPSVAVAHPGHGFASGAWSLLHYLGDHGWAAAAALIVGLVAIRTLGFGRTDR